MKFEVLTIPPFDRQFKRLAKKYPSLKSDFYVFLENLESNPIQGVSLGHDCYKIRLAITSKGKGKSSGARIITNILISRSIVYLLSIYDKSEKDNLTDTELKEFLKFLSGYPLKK
ncbi:type II toxin-antitoxin system RelE/ParE family toxin [Sphingobacterium hungaricum]